MGDQSPIRSASVDQPTNRCCISTADLNQRLGIRQHERSAAAAADFGAGAAAAESTTHDDELPQVSVGCSVENGPQSKAATPSFENFIPDTSISMSSADKGVKCGQHGAVGNVPVTPGESITEASISRRVDQGHAAERSISGDNDVISGHSGDQIKAVNVDIGSQCEQKALSSVSGSRRRSMTVPMEDQRKRTSTSGSDDVDEDERDEESDDETDEDEDNDDDDLRRSDDGDDGDFPMDDDDENDNSWRRITNEVEIAACGGIP